jgi:hypothetical protein
MASLYHKKWDKCQDVVALLDSIGLQITCHPLDVETGTEALLYFSDSPVNLYSLNGTWAVRLVEALDCHGFHRQLGNRAHPQVSSILSVFSSVPAC